MVIEIKKPIELYLFCVGNNSRETKPSGMDTVSDLSIQSHDSSLQRSQDSVQQQRSHDLPAPSGDLPRQGLVDPETAKAFQVIVNTAAG